MRWGGVGVRWVREEKREPGRIVQYGEKEREPEKQSVTTGICICSATLCPLGLIWGWAEAGGSRSWAHCTCLPETIWATPLILQREESEAKRGEVMRPSKVTWK